MEDEIVLRIDIDTDQVAEKIGLATQNLEILRGEQKRITEEFQEGKISAKEYGEQIASVKDQIDKESRSVKANTALLQAQNAATIDANASLDDQRRALNAAQKAYALLSGDEKRAADAAGGLRDQIGKLADQVKRQEQAMGDARRNVGNYAMLTSEAAGKMGVFGRGLQGVTRNIGAFTNGLKAASATPIIAVLGAVVTILQKLAERFKNNSAALERINELLGVFSGLGNIVNIIIDKIAQGIGWIAEKALELADKLGLLTEGMKEGQMIAREDLAIQKEQQKVALANAESQNKIAKLRAEAAEKDKYSAKERLALLQQAADEEESIAKRTYDLAKREYELQVRRNAQSESSQEDLKKENDLKIAMINAETALFQKQKELNSQMATLREQEAKGQELSIDNSQEELKALQALQAQRDLMAKRNRTELENRLLELEQARDKELEIEGLTEEEKKNIRDYYQEQMDAESQKAIQKAHDDEMAKIEAIRAAREELGLEPTKSMEQQELEALETARQADIISQEEYEALKTATVKRYAAERAAITDKEIKKNTIELSQAYATGLTALQGLLGTLSNTFEELGKDSEDSKKASRAFAWVSLLTSQAIAVANTVSAITKAIESATNAAGQTGIAAPITTPIFIAEMVGIVAGAAASAISGIVEAKQLIDQSKGYETGGIVGGNSYTGDRLIARLNSGEMVLNKDSQQRLFDAISGQGDGSLGFNYDLMAQTLSAMPAPVVVYTELQEFGDKVATYQEIASI